MNKLRTTNLVEVTQALNEVFGGVIRLVLAHGLENGQEHVECNAIVRLQLVATLIEHRLWSK